jgi:glycine/D-amino acid oxidase-like deaminating enzyme
MGSSLALQMARRGHRVSLFDRQDEPFAAASRWNEGKLHLGYNYAADPSLSTARSVIEGGVQFPRLIEDLLETRLAGHTTTVDDIYLIHRDSIVHAAQVGETFARIDALVREMARPEDYFGNLATARSRALSRSELAAVSLSDGILAGFGVPERSVDTQWLALRFGDALRNSPGIELRLATKVLSATPVDGPEGRWQVETDAGPAETYDMVVNALWEGRLAIDVAAGLPPAPGWSHRFRKCLFIKTTRPVSVRSALIAVGPFGDVKNYDGRNIYMSWYPIGMVREGHDIAPPVPPALDQAGESGLIAGVRRELSALMNGIDEVFEAAETVQIHGGYVFAKGRGALDDPAATIHRRDRFGATRRGSYLSVDTGKFSTAPWMAESVARELSGE